MAFESEKELVTKDNILSVTIHYCNNLKSNVLFLQPVVCMHVIDSKTGTYAKKSDRNRAVVSFYENQRSDVDYIMPVMTQPCAVLEEKLNMLHWEEEFILNEKYDAFVNKESNIYLFFEIVDLVPIYHTRHHYEQLNQNGMRKIAWAFLKILGCNGVINIGSKLCLQLYKPHKTMKKKKPSEVEVYKWWLKKSRMPLDASLFITVEPHAIFTAKPALRSMLPIQQEKGSTTFEKLSACDKESLSYSEQPRSTHESIQEAEVIWSRQAGEPCKIPLKKNLLLDIISCCQIIKFSSNGRFLTAGCGTHDCYYLMFYQIPHGKIVQKILAHCELIYDIDWSHNDKHILSASGDYSVKMWNSKSWTLVSTFVHPSFVYCSKFHPTSDSIFASSCYDHIIRIWTLEKCQLLKELEAHSSSVCTLCWNMSGTKLYSADGTGQIKIWKKTRNENYHLENEINPKETKGISINKLVLDMQEETLCLFCSDSVARILSLVSGSISFSYESDVPVPKLSKGCCSPCGNLIFLCSEKGNILVWNKNSCDKSNTDVSYNLNYGALSCIEYHPHEHMLALSFWDEGVPVHVFTYEDSIEQESKRDAIKTGSGKVLDCNKKIVDSEDEICSSLSRSCKLINENLKQSKEKIQLTKGTHSVIPSCSSNKKHGAAKYQASKYEETSSSGSTDLFSNKARKNCTTESLAAVIIKSGQFHEIPVPDDSAFSDSNLYRNLGPPGVNDSSVLNRSSKRSQRRRKLRDMNKALL